MRFTLEWLKEHLDFDSSLKNLCEQLTSIGLEVESVSDPRENYKDFVVSRIVSVNQHPNADRLKVCEVFDGNEKLKIVCGANNAKEDLITVLAPIGSIIKAGTKDEFIISKSKIRGVMSSGMLCSEEELGLSKISEGIIELEKKIKVGKKFSEIFDNEDISLDIAITPNRVDCAGIRGIARDLSASGLGRLKDKKIPSFKPNFKTPIKLLNNLKNSSCPEFALRLIKNVKNIPSPNKLIKRFHNTGIKVISSLVDVTNFFTIDYCRPLHVFDFDKIEGNISIRYSNQDEKFVGLDDEEYTLSNGMIVICDEKKIISLAGVMGGKSTVCDENTKNILLESAYFLPDSIASTGRKLKISSDARYRFERGIDPNSTIDGIELATEMILENSGGTIGSIIFDGKYKNKERLITIDKSFFKKILGIKIEEKFIEEKLLKIGCSISKKKDGFNVVPPSWRHDLKIKEDLVEEVGRLYGFEKIPKNPINFSDSQIKEVTSDTQKIKRQLKRLLVSRGMMEIISWTFIDEKWEDLLNDSPNKIKIKNPISTDLSCLRSNLLGNLLSALEKNYNKNIQNLSIFEIGPVFFGNKPGQQLEHICGLRSGKLFEKNWIEKERDFDTFDVKADLLNILRFLNFNIDSFKISSESKPYYHPGKSGAVSLKQTKIGFFGELHPLVLKEFDIKSSACAFELDFSKVMEIYKKKIFFQKRTKIFSLPDI